MNNDSRSARDPALISFGVNALTGHHLVSDIDIGTLAAAALAEEVRRKSSAGEQLPQHRKGRDRGWDDLDPRDLDQARWGVIFAADEDPAVRQTLAPLLEHRHCGDSIYTYKPGEGVVDWITRNGGQPGSGDPNLIPYYLCIVGGPEKIPFAFQHGLDVEYAVGRLYFDQAADYDQYIKNVLAYECPQNLPSNRKAVVLMGASHPGDEATHLCTQHLILPLAEKLASLQISTVLYGGAALREGHPGVYGEMTKANLLTLLTSRSNSLPVLLLTASHGWAYPGPDNRQRLQQGALVCQGWQPGLNDPDPDWLFTARDVPEGADLRGLVIFSFACFSAGTPQFSYYKRLWVGPLEAAAVPIAAGAFIAALPKTLLSRPNGPLGFVGHIEQTWATSFSTSSSESRKSTVIAFERAVRRIITGFPLGHALGDFNDRNSSYTSAVSEFLERKLSNQPLDEEDFANKWLLRNDARGFILLGDPGVAVRAYELQVI